MDLPEWLARALAAENNPAKPQNLLFHGTIEPFEGNLRPTGWEGLLWFSDSPIVSQSYCASAGLSALWSDNSWRGNEKFVPIGDLDKSLFEAMGYDLAAMDITLGRDGRPASYRILPDHPTNANVRQYVTETLGYTLSDGSCWISLKQGKIMPAAWREPGRLYIAQKPSELRLYDMRQGEGGLHGRQWMKTGIFAQVREDGYDGVIISDVHQTPRLGHYEHSSWGLFSCGLEKLTVHQIPCVFFDPADAWYGQKVASTPEWLSLINHARLEIA